MNTVKSTNPDTYMLDLVVDDVTALATPDQFQRLAEYSTTLPTGQYPGKRWKRAYYKPGGYEVQGWMLGEFFETPELTARGEIGIIYRELLVIK